MKIQPKAATIFPWLRDNLGKGALAPLTGSDSRALQAAVQIMEQYAYDRDETLIKAFGLVVARMLPHNQQFAYHCIAHVMNWEDRTPIWFAAGLPQIKVARCKYDSTREAA